jgi:hypothetical protein
LKHKSEFYFFIFCRLRNGLITRHAYSVTGLARVRGQLGKDIKNKQVGNQLYFSIYNCNLYILKVETQTFFRVYIRGHPSSQASKSLGQGRMERTLERTQLGVGLAVGPGQGAPLRQGPERGRVLDGL